ncbi:MAG: hypothetical protein A2539_00135 [Elusimicrobia bacterium RIFOXYD2_FULL_34_15]|nr:MAG: hypothetical protein A2539_00135 [Elusimicrobia bacterium RIFOXYD2_FULL_34_15]
MNKFNIKPENAFLILAVIFGILLVFIIPPFQAPDEQEHFYRAYQVSQLQFVAQKQNEKIGGFLPKSLKETVQLTMGEVPFHPEKKVNVCTISSAFKIPLDPSNKEFTEFSTAIYSPVVYIPQSFGILVGKILNLSPIELIYLGRIFNLIFWVFLIYLAIKIIPIYKWLFFLIALMPMSIFLSASLSEDVITNGLIFLFIAIMFRFVFSEGKKIENIDIIILFFLALCISLTKQTYFLIPTLILLVPVDKFGGKTKFNLAFISLILLCIFVAIEWYQVARNLMIPAHNGVSIEGQILFILSNPFKFLVTAIKTLSSKKYISHFVGQLGWLDTNMSWVFIISYFFILFFIALTEAKEHINFLVKQKAVIFVIFVSTLLLICLAPYITLTPVGNDRIHRLQGRYFIPIAPLFFSLLYNQKIKLSFKLKEIGIICFSALSLIYTIIVLIKRYYI